MKREKPKRGRPASAIDLEQLEKLAGLACTIEEAAAFFGVSKRTLLRRLEDPKVKRVWDDGLLKGNLSLRRKQWAIAQSDSPSAITMLLHLSKHRLGQNDKTLVEMTGKNGGPLQILDLADASHEEILAKAVAFGLPTKIFED
jgi:hypothetical protein